MLGKPISAFQTGVLFLLFGALALGCALLQGQPSGERGARRSGRPY